jgi:transposase
MQEIAPLSAVDAAPQRGLFSPAEVADAIPPAVDPASCPDEPALVGQPRVIRPERHQMKMRFLSLDQIIPLDNPVRNVWAFVEQLDLSALYDQIKAVEGEPGRNASDPRVLFAVCLYATLEGISSGREIARRCTEGLHLDFQWICGEVPVNRDMICAFRVTHGEVLNRVLTDSVAALMKEGLVDLNLVAQDGMRVRASAGGSSFRREPTLDELHKIAQTQVERLNCEATEKENAGATTARQEAARKRAAKERAERIEQALKDVAELAKQKEARKKGDGPKARASTTDPDARVMKMPNGGFNPAFNVQFCTDTRSHIIVGVDVNNIGSDAGLTPPMIDQIKERYGHPPSGMLTDGGYSTKEDIEDAANEGVTLYTPVKEEKEKKEKGVDPFQPLRNDSPAMAAWRQRMGEVETKEIYKKRAATAEYSNAQARNHGMQQFRVRGTEKVKVIAVWYALALNLIRGGALRAAAAIRAAAEAGIMGAVRAEASLEGG